MAEPDPTVPPTEPVAEVYPPLPAEQQPSEPLQPPVQPEPIAQPPPQQQTVVVTVPAAAAPPPIKFGENPVTFTDSNGQQVTTQIQYKTGMLTWAIAGGICFFTGCICLAPIPFCINATKDVVHINPNDGSVVGVYKRLN